MGKRSAIWEQYGSKDANELDVLVCPESDCNGKPYYSLAEFRSHMQRKHGGIAVPSSEVDALPSSDVDESTSSGNNGHRPSESTSVPLPKPKKLSAKARELNDKLNEAINLVIKHFIDGLSELEVERLGTLRGEVSAAVVGVEFDFENRLFSVSGKVALAITVAALYVLPKLPTLKQIQAKAKEQRDAAKQD